MKSNKKKDKQKEKEPDNMFYRPTMPPVSVFNSVHSSYQEKLNKILSTLAKYER